MKNIVLKIKNCNCEDNAPSTWMQKDWIIYDDLSVDFIIYFFSPGSERKKTATYNLDQNQYDTIIKNIQLAKRNKKSISACDGEAWEYIEYNNGSESWKRELGYIYGIKPLENISKCLYRIKKREE